MGRSVSSIQQCPRHTLTRLTYCVVLSIESSFFCRVVVVVSTYYYFCRVARLAEYPHPLTHNQEPYDTSLSVNITRNPSKSTCHGLMKTESFYIDYMCRLIPHTPHIEVRGVDSRRGW